MNRTALVYHREYLKHYAGPYHPECSERLTSVMKILRQSGLLEKVTVLEPEKCSEDDILLCHTKKHLEHIKNLSMEGGGPIDGDTYCRENTYDIARLAVGGAILAGKHVVRGKADNAFALIRPPGHHVTRNEAMGFCYFNNVAIMVRHLQKHYGLRKVCIFDWDVHAGNGTIDVFYDDHTVLMISVHQDPRTMYPGSGFVEEFGAGSGRGYTINIPVPPASNDADYMYLMDEFILDRIRDFGPDMIVVSAGFDSHRADPIGGLQLSEKGYSKMTAALMDVAAEVCGGKLVMALEGGYNLDALATSCNVVLKTMLGLAPKVPIAGEPKPEVKELAAHLKETFKCLW